MGQVFKSLIFWSIAPLAAISSGTNLAIHGLWIKPWLRDVVGISQETASELLFAMTLALITGFLILGILSERFSKIFSIDPIKISIFGMIIYMFLQLAMVYGSLSSPFLLVILLGFFGSSSILVYAGYALKFPKYLSGRVSTMLNFLVFFGAFFLQWGIGVIIQLWPTDGIGYDPESYKVAIWLLFLFQLIGLIWYFFSLKLHRNEKELFELV